MVKVIDNCVSKNKQNLIIIKFIFIIEKISKKLKTFAHTEYNKDAFTNIDAVKKNIHEMRDLFNREHKYYRVHLDNTFPDYILNNQSKFNHWIKQ